MTNGGKWPKHYGGVRDDSDDGGKAAYQALAIGGSSGFNAVFGGRLSGDGRTQVWKPTDSTGRHQKAIRPLHGSTTLDKPDFSTVTATA